jgi:hypothetical protein
VEGSSCPRAAATIVRAPIAPTRTVMADTRIQAYTLPPTGCSSSSQRSAKSAMFAGGNVNDQKDGVKLSVR